MLLWRVEGTRQARTLAAVVLLVIVSGFVVLGAWHVNRPGPYHDEVSYEVPAISVLDHRVDPTAIFGNGPRVPFTHGAYRVMSFPYVGGLKALGFLPVAAVFGASLRTLRLYTIGLGAL